MKSENKMVACLGDYDNSLMNIRPHGPSQEFAEIMYSFSMYPCITKPTRVTTKIASLIDNIFCNNMPDSSLFIDVQYTTISNHFLYFIDKSLTNTNCLKYLKKLMYSIENQEKSLTREKRVWCVVFWRSSVCLFIIHSRLYCHDCFALRIVKSGHYVGGFRQESAHTPTHQSKSNFIWWAVKMFVQFQVTEHMPPPVPSVTGGCIPRWASARRLT